MIIWSGGGIVVAFVFAVCVGAPPVVVNALMGDRNYSQQNAWPVVVGFWLAAIGVFPLGRLMNPGEEQWRFDPEMNKYVVFRQPDKHTFFFNPVQWWSPIFFVIGILYGVANYI